MSRSTLGRLDRLEGRPISDVKKEKKGQGERLLRGGAKDHRGLLKSRAPPAHLPTFQEGAHTDRPWGSQSDSGTATTRKEELQVRVCVFARAIGCKGAWLDTAQITFFTVIQQPMGRGEKEINPADDAV